MTRQAIDTPGSEQPSRGHGQCVLRDQPPFGRIRSHLRKIIRAQPRRSADRGSLRGMVAWIGRG